MTYSVKLEKTGRVLIPAELRKKLRLTPGEDVLLLSDEQGVRILGTRATVLAQVRAELRAKVGDMPPGRLLSEELIADRRSEAEREARES